MDKNKFRYCALLLIDDNNHKKVFVSKKTSTSLEVIINQYT